MITVVGLGPGNPADLTTRAETILKAAQRLFLRTSIHPTVATLQAWGLKFQTFDDLYREGHSFGEVYGRIVRRLLGEGSASDIVYAVPGHPLVGEETVRVLCAQQEVEVEIVPGLSGVEATCARAGVDPFEGLQILDAGHIQYLQPDRHALVGQVYSRAVASEAKLSLMAWYDDDHPVTVIRGAGIPGQERVETVPLFHVDRLDWVDHLTTLYLRPGPLRGVRRLEAMMHQLRAPGGCPWDAEQTHASLRRYCIEEAYEVVGAIDRGDDDELEEELGDLLLQVVFHCELATESGKWTLQDVADRLCEKLVSRHPHLYGDDEARHLGAQAHSQRWDELKFKEKPPNQSVVGGLPLALPALTASEKLQAKAAWAGFEWPDWQAARSKLSEELTELDEALSQGSPAEICHELGDVLTAVVNLGRFRGIDPEQSLRDANARFVSRIGAMEALARGPLKGQPIEALLALWEKAKAQA